MQTQLTPQAAAEAASKRSPESFPYLTLTDVRYAPLEKIDEKQLADACTHPWYNRRRSAR